MNKHLKRLRDSKAARNAAASYLAFASTTITGLISIPLAVYFLTKQELGLWAIITVISGYLNFMELGIGPATGRKMADSIVAKDKAEIDRWWSLTRLVLGLQGALVILVGCALAPVVLSQIAAGFPNQNQALHLFIGMVVMQGVKFPFQGAEGVLTAQERFHWVPLRQAFIFWVELAVLAAGLFSGLGLYAVLWSKGATLVVVWLVNWWLLAKSEPKLGWNPSGLRWDRFRSLFGYSLNLSAVKMIDVVVKSLPVLILGKFGGLTAIPIYTISIKISTVLVSLGKRNYQSFYPALQRMFVQGDKEKFIRKYKDIGLLTISTGLGLSGVILSMNRTGVELLAKPEFYAGPITTAWFAVAAITMPVCGLMYLPLQAAGNLGKSALVAVFRVVLAALLFVLAYRWSGIDGLAGVMALLPMILGFYCYFRGAKEFGCKPSRLSGSVSIWMFVSIIAIMSGGMIIHLFPAEPIMSWVILGKTVSAPSWLELLVGGTISFAAFILFLLSLNRLRKQSLPKSGRVATVV